MPSSTSIYFQSFWIAHCRPLKSLLHSHWQHFYPTKTLINSNCYKLIQRFRVTCLFAGQHNTKLHGTITDVIYFYLPSSLFLSVCLSACVCLSLSLPLCPSYCCAPQILPIAYFFNIFRPSIRPILEDRDIQAR